MGLIKTVLDGLTITRLNINELHQSRLSSLGLKSRDLIMTTFNMSLARGLIIQGLIINDGGPCMPRVVIESSRYHDFDAFCYSG